MYRKRQTKRGGNAMVDFLNKTMESAKEKMESAKASATNALGSVKPGFANPLATEASMVSSDMNTPAPIQAGGRKTKRTKRMRRKRSSIRQRR